MSSSRASASYLSGLCSCFASNVPRTESNMSAKQKQRSKSEPSKPRSKGGKGRNKGKQKSKAKGKHKKVRQRQSRHRLPQSTTNQVVDDFSRGGSQSALSRMSTLHLSQKELLSTYKRHHWTQDKDSSVVVIGGTLAGMHLATLLKRRGFHNVTVLELADPTLAHGHGLVHDDDDDANTAMTEPASTWMLRNPDTLNELIALYADNAKLQMVPVHLDQLEMPLHAQPKMPPLSDDASPSHLPALPSTHSSPSTVSFASSSNSSLKSSSSAHSSAHGTPSMSSTAVSSHTTSSTLTSPAMSTCSSKSNSVSKGQPLGMLEAAKRYAKLHQKICGVVDDLDGGRLVLPKVANPKYINMSLMAFIHKYHLEALLPLFARSHAMLDGLPPLDELPCFYGLYWNDATTFVRMLEGDKQGLWMLTSADGAQSTKYTKSPMQTLLDAMAQRERLSVKHGVSVTSLNRYLNDEKHKICIMYDECDREKLIECDAVFCADDLGQILPAISDVTEEEQAAFGQLTPPASLCVTLFECAVDGNDGHSQIDDEKIDHDDGDETDDDESDDGGDEEVQVNRSRVVRIRCLSRMQHGVRGSGSGSVEQLVAYQTVPMAVGCVDEEVVEAELVADLVAMGKEKVRVVRQRVMAMASRWTAQQIQNEMPWMAAQELQGKYKNCYYIGPSVSFEAAEAVLDFNQQLMRNTLYL